MAELDLRRVAELCSGRRLSRRSLERARDFADEFEYQLQKHEQSSKKPVCDK